MILEIGSVDLKIGFFLDYLFLKNVERICNNSVEFQVFVYVVYIYQWGFIYGVWSFFEDNSFIIEYSWVIGINFKVKYMYIILNKFNKKCN